MRKHILFLACSGLISLASARLRAENQAARLPTHEEALARARLLHESFAETLRVVHRDFFRRDEHLPFPSQSLSEVFAQLATNQNIQARWIAGEDTAMNLDHLPADAFEKRAMAGLVAGQREILAKEDGWLRFAGRITLENKCLKCHLQNRTSLGERAAGLAIRLPYRPE